MNNVEKSKLVIRSLVDQDIEPAISIWWSDISPKEIINAEIRGPNNMSLVAEYEGILVGFVIARSVYIGLPMVGVCLMHVMAVRNDYQQQGIGTALINQLRNNCCDKNIKIIRAPVPEGNERLKKYVEDLGFHPSDTIEYDRLCSDE